ncbi:chromate transporter, chromate ion transporter (CHR) family [Rubidibacter lacunae KORDI 51-2]|uniref:Chromate transporter, chromate ion transporter (CHR) family n=1 Tax=Rubidibacter lacunae KORDI 51-2 TaxID=582515 RepID=U5DMQ3_9CHRO|nr:chromate efflux transporter [Rubidibacter lacunae]ERN41894.1 chromate transporter, chromate ion transporter (CHR) family [Rubidibacter lacunae KORDI 51-2]
MSSSRLIEIAGLFLKLGTIGFGGPAAHIAMMEEEVVERRQWLTREHFLDLLGATNLIPGPNSTEMAIHVGYTRGGLPGLAIAGICFIFPAVTITAALAAIYVAFGALPQAEWLLLGIKPAVLAVILGALWRLGKKAIKTWKLAVIGAIVAALLMAGLNEVGALLVGGAVGMVWLRLSNRDATENAANLVLGTLLSGIALRVAAATAGDRPADAAPLWQLGLAFLKVGCVLFGSGYVLVAFLEGEVVARGWLTQQQLLDAIALGQFTPGPVLSTATFVGYTMAGWSGALVATLGIFLPSFIFVAVLNPLVPRLRRSPWTAAFLDAVNASAVALMAVVTVRLGYATLLQPNVNAIAIVTAAIAAVLLFRFRLNSAWIVLFGAAVGGGATALISTGG